MKKISCIYLLAIAFLLSFTGIAKAQRVKVEDVKHRRNSVCLLLMNEEVSEEMKEKNDIIVNTFLSAEVPLKYNDHNIEVRLFDPARVELAEEDHKAFSTACLDVLPGEEGEDLTEEGKAKKKGGGFGGMMKGMAKSLTGGGALVDGTDKDELAVRVNKYLCQEKIAKQLIDKWFLEEGEFDEKMTLIYERGVLGADDFDMTLAGKTQRGEAAFADARTEVIGSTFVVASKYRYLSKDELVAEIDSMAQLVASATANKYAGLAADAAMLTLKASLGAGYYVRITSYLFQLRWDGNMDNRFDAEFWGNKEAYEAADCFALKYIGRESAFANVKAGVFTNKPEEELIQIASINANDAVLAKLEKKYDVFKTKTPIFEVDDEKQMVWAKIGTREGVAPGDKYEVLEQIEDETGKITYKRKTVLKVGKTVWKNDFGMEDVADAERKEENAAAATLLEYKKGLYPGMLLRQVK